MVGGGDILAFILREGVAHPVTPCNVIAMKEQLQMLTTSQNELYATAKFFAQELINAEERTKAIVQELGKSYLDMARVIRKHQMTPAESRVALLQAGMSKPRISELLRIALCSDEIFRTYQAGDIGRVATLKLIRAESEPQLAKADVPAEQIALEDKLKLALHAILVLAEKMNLRSETARLNGWRVVVSKEKKNKGNK